MTFVLPAKDADARVGEIIKLAVMAVGGQGGGVLTSWIEALARSQGYACQATSVAGVAQRTGTTIYYVEMTPESDQQPIFALAPAAGDVDVLIAAEMMEVGRSVLRGFVTPDRTTLIGSTHRALAVSEKTAPGDAIADSDEVRVAAEIAAKSLILANMDELALGQGSVISSSLFGALAGSGALPFAREAFEDAIRAGDKGVEPSLRAFSVGFDTAQNGIAEPKKDDVKLKPEMKGTGNQIQKWEALVKRTQGLPQLVQHIALSGLMKVVDFQDTVYGARYLQRIEDVVKRDDENNGWLLSQTAAKYIANAMAYDDLIRVADLKTRGPRFNRIREEMGVESAQLVQLTEFFHPRAEEIASLMPAMMGAKWEKSPKRMALLNKLFNKGRRLRTHTLGSFLMLYFLGGLKGYRMRTRRHEVEVEHLERWLEQSLGVLETDYALAVEMFRNRRLVKGYSDTHLRGLSKFRSVMEAADLLEGRTDAAEWMARLREAAIKDPEGKALAGAIQTVRSFV